MGEEGWGITGMNMERERERERLICDVYMFDHDDNVLVVTLLVL